MSGRWARAVLAAACVGALVACRKAEAPKPEPKSVLQDLSERLTSRAPCSRTIPDHWSAGMPVPALQQGKLVYKVFFAGWEGNPKKGIVDHDAEGDAVFAPDGTILSCAQRNNTPAKYPAHLDTGVSSDEWDQRRVRLYALTEKAAEEYASGKPDRAVLAEYSAAFAQLEDPELAASYRALSPGFWSWLEANGGRGPKPGAAAPVK